MQPPKIVDKPLLRQRLARALARDARQSVGGATFLLDRVTDDLIERLGAVERHFETAIAMMGVTGRLAAKLAASGKAGAIYRIERVAEAFAEVGDRRVSGLVGDEEALPIVFDLLRHEGHCLGGSSGINVAGAIRLARHLGPGHTIVTLLCDFGTRYQSKLFNPAFLREKGLPTPSWLE